MSDLSGLDCNEKLRLHLVELMLQCPEAGHMTVSDVISEAEKLREYVEEGAPVKLIARIAEDANQDCSMGMLKAFNQAVASNLREAKDGSFLLPITRAYDSYLALTEEEELAPVSRDAFKATLLVLGYVTDTRKAVRRLSPTPFYSENCWRVTRAMAQALQSNGFS